MDDVSLRGITSGRAGFCTGTGDAYLVIKRFTELVPNNPLAKYIPELNRLLTASNPSDISKLQGYSKVWGSLGNDNLFRQAQDEIVDSLYYRPSQDWANKLGLKLNLSRGQLYDAFIMHGNGFWIHFLHG